MFSLLLKISFFYFICFQKIKDFVKRCLAQAEKFGHSSICFPTVGTGNFKYPDNDSAKAMFDAIQEHFTVPPQSLKKIVIALFSKAANTIQVIFEPSHEIMSLFVIRKLFSNAHVQPSSGTRCLIFDWPLRLLLYFVSANSEGSCETAWMRRLA